MHGNPSLTATGDQTDGATTTGRSRTSQTRLSSQTGQSGGSVVTVSHVHGRQQRSTLVSAGNEGDPRLVSHTQDNRQGQSSTTAATDSAQGTHAQS